MTDTVAALRRAFDRSFAAPPPAGLAMFEDFLAIRMGEAPYAVRLPEIAGLHAGRKIVPIPRTAPELLGIVGLRGTLVPVFDLHLLLGCPEGAGLRWLILVSAPQPVALAFEQFEGYVRIPGAPQPARTTSRHISGAVLVAGVPRPIIDMASVLEAIAKRKGTP
jgi:chemotaxis signal transduction protein